ncbi:hypothetical protein p1B332 (plasmid) [Aromatoleum aromaticum EbN1]|uniref:Uncharacterized protein n=1 Tax=Aromatoleum aromaticum (strain DSM 19018 / LMG 30748 / EbN1) TaxID=76114 RepID=Q5NWR6_AROAE|nr:hypothetical protein p1B332 [Aromatoleum aromaticum EbN1]
MYDKKIHGPRHPSPTSALNNEHTKPSSCCWLYSLLFCQYSLRTTAFERARCPTGNNISPAYPQCGSG